MEKLPFLQAIYLQCGDGDDKIDISEYEGFSDGNEGCKVFIYILA